MPAVLHHAVDPSTAPHVGYEGYGGYNRTLEDDYSTPHGGTFVRVSMSERTKRTWDGVFLPVSLSIFGFVLFARLPWMVGECGLWLTLVGIVLCFTVTLFTTISLAAISTNGFTGDGGPYMMVARCLGPQIGTTVGVTFVLANSVATAMYLVGGTEIVVDVLDNARVSAWYSSSPYVTTLTVSSLMLLLLLAIACLKVEKVFRVVCLALALVSVVDVIIYILRVQHPPPLPQTPPTALPTPTAAATLPSLWDSLDDGLGGQGAAYEGFTGLSLATFRRNWNPSFSSADDFQRALAVLFPGVSGLMSGVCLSGDLRNGAKAIPRGIGYAWSLSFVTYIVVAILVGGSMDRDVLRTRFDALRRGASDTWVYAPGEFVASFAAGLSMMVGSARVLRAIARDGLLPFRFMRRLANASSRQVTVLHWLMIQLILLIGNTYTDASVVATQVFCANFLALNLSTFLSSVTGIISFRPVYAFFNTTTALCGALLCGVVMFFINPLVAIGTLVFMSLILVVADMYIDPTKVSWGDASQPLVFYVVRKWLLRLDERKEHVRHWRPSILHVVTDPLCSLNLVHITNNLKKGGLYELCLVLEGTFQETIAPCFQWKGWLMDFIATSGIKAFAVVTFGQTLRGAIQGMMRTCGLGGMRPNTVLLSIDEVLQREYFGHIYDAYCTTGGADGTIAAQTATAASSTNVISIKDHYNATLGGGTQDTFGTVRPLKDVNNRATEFFDLKRDKYGNVLSTKSTHGGTMAFLLRQSAAECNETATHEHSDDAHGGGASEREPLLASSQRAPKSQPKRDDAFLAPPSSGLPRRAMSAGRRESLSASWRAGSLGRSGSLGGRTSCRASAAVLDPADDADELAQTIGLDMARHSRTVHFADLDQLPDPALSSSPLRASPVLHHLQEEEHALSKYPSTERGDESVEVGDDQQQMAFSLTRTAVGLLTGSAEVPKGSLPITRTATAIFNEQLKKRRCSTQPAHQPLAAAVPTHTLLTRGAPQLYGSLNMTSSGSEPMAGSALSPSDLLPKSTASRPSLRAVDAENNFSFTSPERLPGTSPRNMAQFSFGAAVGESATERDAHVNEIDALANLMMCESTVTDVQMLQTMMISGEDFSEVVSVEGGTSTAGGEVAADGGDVGALNLPASMECASSSAGASSHPGGLRSTLLRLLHHGAPADSASPAASRIGPAAKTREGFRTWLEQTMFGRFTAAAARAAAPNAHGTGSSQSMEGRNEQHPHIPHSVDATVKFLEESMAKAHEMKVPFGWGLFRAPHTFESKVVEQQLLERMIAQRHAARLTGDPDLCGFADITEFCSIARDVSLMQMNLLLARNMDKLNMAELSQANKREVYVDVWVPHDSDAILFLLSYSFSLTSVWRKRGVLRVVSVVSYEDEVDDETLRLKALLREHRLGRSVHVLVISLEEEARARSMSDSASVLRLLETATGRAEVLNALMRREVDRNGGRTAMIFVRVASYAGPDVASAVDGGSAAEEASEDWFANLLLLSNQLPPMLLLAAGNLKCRSNEW